MNGLLQPQDWAIWLKFHTFIFCKIVESSDFEIGVDSVSLNLILTSWVS